MDELNIYQRLRKELYEKEEGNIIKAEMAFNFIIYGTYVAPKGADNDIDKYQHIEKNNSINFD